MKQPQIYTIAASAPFAETLARGLIERIGPDPLSLSSSIIYLPTQRAARNFGEAFARVLGGSALLPQLKPLGDTEDDEALLDLLADGLEIKPAISPLRRRLLLAQLVQRWDRTDGGGTLSFAQYVSLAESLAGIMDEVETQGCDLSGLKDLAPAELAEHWERVTRFLDVIRQQWPAILQAENALNPAERRVQRLQFLAARLQTSPPKGWVIAAGSTGSIPATAQLLKVIAHLPQGAVVLPGLDLDLDRPSWDSLDPGHPQFGLAHLLASIGCEREDVKDWFASPKNTDRENLLSQALRPAPTTNAWRKLAESRSSTIAAGLKGMGLCLCADPAHEALTIALALRQALETPGHRAALVTPDRNLARRVAAELTRWGIVIDDSAGRPLAHTAAGSFLCLLAEAADREFAPVPLLALLKHPFARRREDHANFRAYARQLDRWCLRGPRPDKGLQGIERAIDAARANPRNSAIAEPLAALSSWWKAIADILAPLEDLFAQDSIDISTACEELTKAAEDLAQDDRHQCLLWANDDGQMASALCAALKDDAKDLPPIEPKSFSPLLRNLAMAIPVRATFGRHPRLQILGPLEARLQRFDLTILGGLNEGTWPQSVGADPWFSRPMRRALKLEQPERRIGLSAHDFAMLAAGPHVLLTRARKVDGAPTTASRWLERLTQLIRGLGLEHMLAAEPNWTALALQVMDVDQAMRLPCPAPRPPVAARPKRLSVTEIETWLRDPYAIYAKHVLRLRPLEPLNAPVGPLERGTALHKAVELFIKMYQTDLPDNAAEQLLAIADQVFADAEIPKAVLGLWRPRFQGAAKGFVALERDRRAAIMRTYLEVSGAIKIGDFTLTGVADRIDLLKDGRAAIIDYKSGEPPTIKQVAELLSPQLPLEAAMLAQNGFGIGAVVAEELMYLSLANETSARQPRSIHAARELAQEALARLKRRIAWFNEADTAYRPRVRPFRADSVGDYDHLARVREWSPSGWSDER